MKRIVGAAVVTFALVACTTTYPVVGKFSDHNEVFLGQVNNDLMTGRAFIEAKGKNTGVRCRGVSRVIHVPASNYIAGAFLIPYCAGQKGIAELRCDDNRWITADWTADSCSSGQGSGADQKGARFDFVFGLSEQEASARLGTYQTEVASKPDLPVYKPREERKKRGYATGTGFFVSADGHVLTNHHVVEGSTNVAVMVNGTERAARLVGDDAEHDFALLKVDGSFQPLPIGSSATVARADEVFTLGFPVVSIQGNAQKATFGRVNALSGLGDDPKFIQIDVPVQPGNSGGPLISRDGNVVGVVTMTLDQISALRATGSLPQNVNYAGKIDGAAPLLKSVGVRGRQPAGRSLQALVQDYEKSVVLVIAR